MFCPPVKRTNRANRVRLFEFGIFCWVIRQWAFRTRRWKIIKFYRSSTMFCESSNDRTDVPDNWPIDINMSTINHLDILDYIGVRLYEVMRDFETSKECGENAEWSRPEVTMRDLFKIIPKDIGIRFIDDWEDVLTYNDYLAAPKYNDDNQAEIKRWKSSKINFLRRDLMIWANSSVSIYLYFVKAIFILYLSKQINKISFIVHLNFI